METTGEAERDGEWRVAVTYDIAEGIVVNPFDGIAAAVGDEAERAYLVVGQIIGGAACGHSKGQSAVGVLEPLAEDVIAVVDGEQGRLARPEVLLHDGAVDLLGDSSTLGIVDIGDDRAVGQGDATQFAGGGVDILGGLAVFGSGRQIVVEVELVGYWTCSEGMVLLGMGEGPVGNAQSTVQLVGAVASAGMLAKVELMVNLFSSLTYFMQS